MKQLFQHSLNKAVLLALVYTIHVKSTFIFTQKDCAECNPGFILPCVIQDVCTTCGTKSCTSCNKCSSGCGTCKKDDLACTIGCFTCNTCSAQNGVESNGRCMSCNNTNNLPPLGRQRACTPRCGIRCNTIRSIFIPRSLGANTAREFVGWQEFIHKCTPGCNYITTAHSLGYSRSFRPERIARYLFGGCTLSFSGSQIADRTECELLADNFGLSTTFRGSIDVSPIIDNIFFDNQIFVGLDGLCCGLYLRVHAPLVHSRWDLRFTEKDRNKQECVSFPPCYMSNEKVQSTCDIKKALSGNFTFGAMKEAWHYGRFKCGEQTKTGIADIDLIVGWDFLKCATYHLGIFGLVVAPTGNKPTSRFIFEPIIGNGKRIELGGGISSHIILWEEGPDQSLGVYLEGNITHMFKSRQMRSFDFCNNGPLSRYMLLKEFTRQDSQVVPTGRIINGINFATREVEVSVPVKGDVSVKVAYRSPCISFDIGYNFYGHAQERIAFCKTQEQRLFGIKGTEGICALEYTTVGTEQPLSFGNLVGKISLNATQNNATITNEAATDNATSIQVPNGNVVVTALSRQTGLIVGQEVEFAQNSRPPILLSEEDLSLSSGAAGATATHKIFGYLGYTFIDPCNQRWYVPYLGIGGELEVEALACNEQTSLNQWSIWVKGGIEF